MDYLRTYWIKEIMVPVGQDDDIDAKCEDEIDNEDDDLSAGAVEMDSFNTVSGGITETPATMMLTSPSDFCDLGEMATVGRATDFVMLDSFHYPHADFPPMQVDAAADEAALFSFDEAVAFAAAASAGHHQTHTMHLRMPMQAPQYPQHLSFDTDMM
jgi:hypothetical protein